MASNISLTRHAAQCTICRSPFRAEVDAMFVQWVPAWEIVASLGNVSIDTLYRHARACGLILPRRENAIAGFESIADSSKNDSHRLAALKEILRHNERVHAQEQQNTDMKELLGRMTVKERQAFAEDGSLPGWLTGSKVATPVDFSANEAVENKGSAEGKAATNSTPSEAESSTSPMPLEAVAADSLTAVREHPESVEGDRPESSFRQEAPTIPSGDGPGVATRETSEVTEELAPTNSSDSPESALAADNKPVSLSGEQESPSSGAKVGSG